MSLDETPGGTAVRDGADARERRVSVGAIASVPLWGHLLVLLVVVAAFVVLSRPGNGFTSDEGAAISQARLLRDDGTWYYHYPLEWLDGADEARPFIRADVGSKGVAPYAKHPTYSVVLWAAGASTAGALALSVLGTCAGALTAALISRRFSDAASVPVVALWLTGVATPLLFDAGLLLAHTLAAAAFGLAVLGALHATDRGPRGRSWLAGACVAALAATLLRTEGVLAVLALSVAVAVVARTRRSMLVAVALAASAVGGVLLDRWLQPLIVGVPGVVAGNTLTSGLRGRWDGFYVTWLSTSADGRQTTGTLLWVALVAIAAAALLRRRGRIGDRAFASIAVLAAGAYVLQLLVRPDVLVPGLLVTVPVVWTMAWFVEVGGASRDWWIGLVAVAGGASAVLATQYSIGGGVEWGGRYFAVLLPLAVAVVVSGAAAGLRRCLTDRPARVALLGAAAVATMVLVGMQVATLRDGHRAGDRLARGIARAAASLPPDELTERPIVLTSNRLLPQLLYDEVDRYDWVAADAEELPGFAGQLADAGADGAVLVVPSGSAVPSLVAGTGWTVRARNADAVYDIFVLERSDP